LRKCGCGEDSGHCTLQNENKLTSARSSEGTKTVDDLREMLCRTARLRRAHINRHILDDVMWTIDRRRDSGRSTTVSAPVDASRV
jgi:hypothetical protein